LSGLKLLEQLVLMNHGLVTPGLGLRDEFAIIAYVHIQINT